MSDPDQAQLERAAERGGAFRLRSEGPVKRLSRKVPTGLVGVGAVVVFGALIWALYQGNRRPGSGSELTTPKTRRRLTVLSTLPRDHSGLPQNPPQGAPRLERLRQATSADPYPRRLATQKPLIFRQALISDVKTMARVPRTFTQGDITRAVKGAFAAGAQSVRIEVGAEGQIIVIAGKSGTVPTDANASETSEDVKKLL